MEQNKWEAKEWGEESYAITNGEITIVTADACDNGYLLALVDLLNGSGYRFHSENKLELDLHIEAEMAKLELAQWKNHCKELQAKCDRYDELYRLCFSNLAKLRARCQDNERMVIMGDNIRAVIEETTNSMLAMPQPDNTGRKPYLVQSATEALSAGEGDKKTGIPALSEPILNDEDLNDWGQNKKEDKQ
jgi:hypothetical protein